MLQILIRIGSGFGRAEMTHKNRKKIDEFHFFKVLDVLFWGPKASVVLYGCLGIRMVNCNFWSKKDPIYSSLFFKFLVIKTLDPDPDSLEMLDPDPQHWSHMRYAVILLSLHAHPSISSYKQRDSIWKFGGCFHQYCGSGMVIQDPGLNFPIPDPELKRQRI